MQEIILKIDNFEGPLDLLLHLIDSKKLNIATLKISQIIDEYLLVINSAKDDNIEIKSEFLVIASELLTIKAMSLLKKEEEEIREKDLKKRLAEYKIFKEISLEIQKMENVYNISYSRSIGRKIIKKIPKEYDLDDVSVLDIYNNYKKFLDEWEYTINIELDKRYNLNDEMENLYLKIYHTPKTFYELFSVAREKTHLIYIFLAILELYKEGKINIENGVVSKC